MAKKVVVGGYVQLGSGPTNYSSVISNATLLINIEEGDTTNYASSGWHERVAGLIDPQITIEFKEDDDLSGLNSAIWSASKAGGGTGTIAFRVRDNSGSIDANTNVEYRGTALITQFSLGPRQLGQVLGQSVTWPVTGSVTRHTS